MSEATLRAFKLCMEADADYRTTKDIENVQALIDYYENHAEDLTRKVNTKLGVGLTDVVDEYRPIQVGLLRYAIDRQAVVYSRPPTRWLRGKDRHRMAAKDEQVALMREVYKTGRIDLVLRNVDRYANLLQVVALRVYGLRDRVDVRMFTPNNVRRNPDPTVQTDIARDASFALKLAGNQWEFWERKSPLDAPASAELWEMSLVRWTGREQGSTLLQEPTPQRHLPAMLVYEQHGHQAWPKVRDSRLAGSEAINAMGDDLWAGVRMDTHNTRVWKGVSADDIPRTRGHGKEVAIDRPPASVEVQDLSPQPQIDSSVGVQQQTISLFLVTEDLPPDDLDRNKQVVTGAASRTRLFGLVERRNAQAMLAPHNEAQLYKIVRVTWNSLSLFNDGLAKLDDTTTMDVELAPLDLPMDANIEVQSNEKAVALRTKSRVEVIMGDRGISRDAAEEVKAQIEEDEADSAADAKETMAGAQTEAFTVVIEKVHQGLIPRESGKVVLMHSYHLPDEEAEAALGPTNFKPVTKEPPAGGNSAPPTNEEGNFNG
jgi:hypothetical protein